ncbi:MAG TPA: PHP domain-containing protein [Candidatus Bathyarchaeia archaeon]
MIRADLHIHTKYSPDASTNPKTIVDQLHAHPTIKAIAITDHNTLEGYKHVRQLASAYKDIIIIPAVEIGTPNGDIIILGAEELPPTPFNTQSIIDFAKQRAALTIVAHPYRAFGLGDTANNYSFDAIETLNGASTPHANRLAENLAKTMGLPGVAGSDAHSAEELWSVYTEIQADSDIDAILKAIKRGLVRVART